MFINYFYIHSNHITPEDSSNLTVFLANLKCSLQKAQSFHCSNYVSLG